MIIFTPQEYEQWSNVLEAYVAARKEAYKLPEAKRFRALSKADDTFTNDRDRVVSVAHERTIKGFSTVKLYEDTVAAIMYDVWCQIRTNEISIENGGVAMRHPAETWDDLDIYEQVDELNRRPDGAEYYTKVLKLWDRYHEGDVTRAEAEPHKDYMPIRVEIAVDMALDKIDGEALPAIRGTNYPKQLIYTTDAVTQKIFSGELVSKTLAPVRVSPKKSEEPINTVVMIDYEHLEGVSFSRQKAFTPFDREVLNAVTTLYVEGNNEYITAEAIYKIMTGDTKARLQPVMRGKIVESMAILGRTFVKIDATREALEFYNVDRMEFEESALIIRKATVERGKERVDAYQILGAPILYKYASGKKQIGRAPAKLLKSSLKTSEEIIILKGYLLRRVEQMKNSARTSRNIRYATIFESLGTFDGLTDPQKVKKRGKLYKFVDTILSEWVTDGYITSYSVNKNNNTYESITIAL